MSKEAAYYRLGLKIFADFGGTIAVPAVLAALIGKWLDARYQTAPRFLMILLLVAFVLTAVFIVKKAKKYLMEYESLMKQNTK